MRRAPNFSAGAPDSAHDVQIPLDPAPPPPLPNASAASLSPMSEEHMRLEAEVVRCASDLHRVVYRTKRSWDTSRLNFMQQIARIKERARLREEREKHNATSGAHLVETRCEMVHKFPRPNSSPHHQLAGLLKFGPDGLLYYAETSTRRLSALNLETQEVLVRISSPFVIYCFAFDPSGEYLATGGHGQCSIYDFRPSAPLQLLHNLQGLTTTANSVCFYRYAGELRLIVNHNNSVDSMMVYSVATGKRLFQKTVPEPTGTRINHCAIHPNGEVRALAVISLTMKFLVAVGDLHELYLLRIAENTFVQLQRLASPLGDVHMCAWSPDGRFAAAASDGHNEGSDCVLAEKVNDELVRVPVPPVASAGFVIRNVSFSPSGLIAYTHNPGRARILHPDLPQFSTVVECDNINEESGYGHYLLGATFDSEDNFYIAVQDGIMRFRRWNFPSLLELCTRKLRIHRNQWVSRAHFLPLEIVERLTELPAWQRLAKQEMTEFKLKVIATSDRLITDYETNYNLIAKRLRDALTMAENAGVKLSKPPEIPAYIRLAPLLTDEQLNQLEVEKVFAPAASPEVPMPDVDSQDSSWEEDVLYYD